MNKIITTTPPTYKHRERNAFLKNLRERKKKKREKPQIRPTQFFWECALSHARDEGLYYGPAHPWALLSFLSPGLQMYICSRFSYVSRGLGSSRFTTSNFYAQSHLPSPHFLDTPNSFHLVELWGVIICKLCLFLFFQQSVPVELMFREDSRILTNLLLFK